MPRPESPGMACIAARRGEPLARESMDSELRYIRVRLQERLQNRGSTVGCLLQDVHNAFSKLRLCATNLVTESTENNRMLLLAAADAAEAACRQRMNNFHSEHIDFIEDVLCHGNHSGTDQKSVMKHKVKEFDELKLSELDLTSKSIAVQERKEPKRRTASSAKRNVAEVFTNEREIVLPRPASKAESPAVATIHKRPASSLGIARDWGTVTTSPVSVVLPQNLAVIDSWPNQSVRVRPISPFLGSSDLPNRGHLAGPSGVTRLSMSEKRENLCDTNLPTRTDSTQPKEMARIERFIEIEFRRRKCSLDVYNEERFEIFQEAFLAVIRVFRSWSPLLVTIHREYDKYVAKLSSEAIKLKSLEEHVKSMEKDYSCKFELLRSEADKVLEQERIQSSSQIISLSQSLSTAISQRALAEESCAQERSKALYVSDHLAEAQRQQALLLKGYNEQMRDLTRMMEATGVSSVNDLIKRFREMVHIQALWEVEARLQEEKAVIKLEKDSLAIELAESKAFSKNSYVRTQAAEHKYLEISKEQEALLKFFPAQFPEATDLKMIGGKTCIVGSDGKLKEATMRSALFCLRKCLDIQNEIFEDAVHERKNLRLKLATLQHLIEAAEEQWKPLDFFDGLGEGMDVPAILRAHGRIKNRHLSKAQTERAVKQILSKRRKGDLHQQEDCWTTVLHYAGQNYGSRAMEWGYSFFDALKKYAADTDIGCFYKILMGRFGEAVYWRTTEIILSLQGSLKQRDEHLHKPARGKLPRKEFLQAITDFFQPTSAGGSGTLKSRAKLEELWHELDKDERSSNQWGVSDKEIQYVKLFSETKDGSQSHFVEMLRRHILEEQNEYLSDISCTVERYRADRLLTTTATELRQAIRKVDPDKPLDQVDKIVHDVFGRKSELPNQEFKSKLRLLLAERTTDRVDPRVHRALKPKSNLLLLAEKKVRQVRLYVRVVNAFVSFRQEMIQSRGF